MPFYSLLDSNTQKTLPSHSARERAKALDHFGELLGCQLTDRNPDGSVNRYLLDEWDDADRSHWIDHKIPVWVCQR